MNEPDILRKANRVLNLILLAFLLICIRIWYLAVVEHEEHLALAKRPQSRTLYEPANRGTIRDRFNHPLAVNKIQYNAAICFDPIRQIPRIKWIFDQTGKGQKVFERRKYIELLSKLLADHLDLNAIYIEDLIYSKAAIFPNTPFVLKENIPEKLYYQLKMLEKNWPGLQAQIGSRRFYPNGSTAGNLLGYMGSISQSEYTTIHNELNNLKDYISGKDQGLPLPLPKGFASTQDVRDRISELKEKSYTINTRIGKSGIEGKFDEDLRGFSGKQKYQVDIRGNLLRKLPESYAPTSGRRLILSLSLELQEYAESLLAEHELDRHRHFSSAGRNHSILPQPWIMGGAVVAMIPTTGEIVALASYPECDPNDFSFGREKQSVINKWLETPQYIGELWDGQRTLERDFSKTKHPSTLQNKLSLSWNAYLDAILAKGGAARSIMDKVDTLQKAVYLPNAIESLLKISDQPHVSALIDTLFPPQKGHKLSVTKTNLETRQEIEKKLLHNQSLVDEISSEISSYLAPIEHNSDKLLVLDLCRLIAPNHLFDDDLLEHVGNDKLTDYRTLNQSLSKIQKMVEEFVDTLYKEIDFPKWRNTYFSGYLKEKRTEERLANKHQKPYLDYLTEMQNKLSKQFFIEHRWEFLKAFVLQNASLQEEDPLFPYFSKLIAKSYTIDKDPKLFHLARPIKLLKQRLIMLDEEYVVPYIKTMRNYDELIRPLWGRYHLSSKAGRIALEKDLARHFYPSSGHGYSKSYAYRENTPLGSIFKIVTGYEAMRQNGLKKNFSNPLTLIDESPSIKNVNAKTVMGYTSNGLPIHRKYKGGILPRGHPHIGKVDLPKALEQSSNIYFSLLAEDFLEHPNDLNLAAKNFGFGEKTGIDLTGEVRGSLPSDLKDNKTGLYAYAIGQHSLAVTPLQTAVMLSALANGGEILKPEIVNVIANIEPKQGKEALFSPRSYRYQDYLSKVGLFFPFFTEPQNPENKPYIKETVKEIRRRLYMPFEIRNLILQGLYEVVNGPRGTSRPMIIRSLYEKPKHMRDYKEIMPTFTGKTSTSEVTYKPFLDRESPPVTCKHIWFGGISFKEQDSGFNQPELVVVVFLRFGDYGREATPIATQIVKKWREIVAREEMKRV